MPHILIVDDDEMITSVFKRYLDQRGYWTTVAHDGQAALDIGKEVVIDALITDYRLPRLSAPELVARLKKDQPDLPVIFTTALGDEIDLPDDGKTKVLYKPMQLSELLICLSQMKVRPEHHSTANHDDAVAV